MRIFCVSMTVPVESRLTMRKSRNGLLRFPHGNRTGHQNPLSYEPRESLPNRAARGPILLCDRRHNPCADRAATFRSEEHTSELQSLMRISYAVFCLKKKKNKKTHNTLINTQVNHHKQKNTSKS